MALANMGFKDQNWSHLGEEETVERERGEQNERRRGRGRRWRSQASQGMELTLDMNSSMDHMDFVWLIACLQKLGFC